MPINLFDAARGNAVSLRQRLDDALVALPQPDRDALTAFRDHVQDQGRVGLNMRMSTAAEFLADSTHQNIYDFAAQQAKITGHTEDEVLRRKLGSWYDKRTAFDNACHDGRHFRYGALNAGGLGASYYGDWCAIVAETKWTACALVYLEADSLKTYMLPGVPALDQAAIATAAAPSALKGTLAALKHAVALPGLPTNQWPQALCSSTEYIEAIFTGGLEPRELESMRVAKKTYEVYADFAYEFLAGGATDDERNLMALFGIVVKGLQRTGIPVETIDV
ncbi:MAG: hypothetical protein R2729_31310 [Bryobacteraceae bacterium]